MRVLLRKEERVGVGVLQEEVKGGGGGGHALERGGERQLAVLGTLYGGEEGGWGGSSVSSGGLLLDSLEDVWGACGGAGGDTLPLKVKERLMNLRWCVCRCGDERVRARERVREGTYALTHSLSLSDRETTYALAHTHTHTYALTHALSLSLAAANVTFPPPT
jgi:hypothetical protein